MVYSVSASVRHPTAIEFTLDGVAVAKRRSEPIECVRHRSPYRRSAVPTHTSTQPIPRRNPTTPAAQPRRNPTAPLLYPGGTTVAIIPFRPSALRRLCYRPTAIPPYRPATIHT